MTDSPISSAARTRRDLLKAGAAGVLTAALAGRSWAGGPARPNVLILTTDQQRVDAAGASGNPWAKTPAMDCLASRGVSFRKSYCPYPLCSPSRSALHTSRPPHELLVDHNSMPIAESAPLSGQVFRQAGYDTGYAGKWHMPDPYPADGIRGYEVLNKTTRKGKLAHDVDEATMNAAIAFLRRKRDKPFLLVASFINPHDICLLAGGENKALNADVWKRYESPAGAELPPLPPNHELTDGAAGPAGRLRHGDWDKQHWRQYRYAYFRMMEDVDRQIGAILDALRQSGQEDNTLIVFTSDHGEGLGGHRWTGKMNFYDDEAAVPLILSWKGVIPAGRADADHLVTALDVLPTICDYAGVKGPEVMRGQSLRGVIDKPGSRGHEYVVSEMAPGGPGGRRSFMVRTAKYKYVVFHAPAQGEMFFDMDADPGEMKNLVARSDLAAEIDRHRALLKDWCRLTEEEKYPIRSNPVGKAGKGGKKNQKKGKNT